MRYAVYFTPPHDDPLTETAQSWLGRNAFTGESLAAKSHVAFSGAKVSLHTASPRRYGFHATIVAPFTLKGGVTETELVEGLHAFCAKQNPIAIQQSIIGQMDAFFAIVPAEPHVLLNQLANDAVVYFSDMQAPLNERELARRTSQTLSARQISLLQRWGYPFVMEEFRFHMTLTGKVPASERAAMSDTLRDVFADALKQPLEVGGLALFVEPEPGAPFMVRSYVPFLKQHARKTA